MKEAWHSIQYLQKRVFSKIQVHDITTNMGETVSNLLVKESKVPPQNPDNPKYVEYRRNKVKNAILQWK